jgi:regulator of replication initiation timing
MFQLRFFDEIKNINYNVNEIRNLLSAIVRQSGSIIKTNSHIKLELSLDDYEKAFFVNGLIKQSYFVFHILF